MEIYLTRDSVCAGDDGDAPHAQRITLPDGLAFDELVREVLRAAKLPSISGDYATWSLCSIVPIAVIAQQWTTPRLLQMIPPKLSSLDVADGVLRMHFTYHAQHDPDLVADVLKRLRTRAE